MASRVWRRPFAPSCCVRRHQVRVIAAALLGLATGACAYNGQPIGPFAASRNTTIAIESIEGPPPALAGTLAANLKEAAEARQLAIVAREEQAQYRLRGYLTTHAEHGKTSVSWVWDIYGSDQRRAARITGEEPGRDKAGDKSADAWAAVDDRVLRRIAQSGVDRVLLFLNTAETSKPAFAMGVFPREIIQASGAPPTEFR
jgi:hypothetical protein